MLKEKLAIVQKFFLTFSLGHCLLKLVSLEALLSERH
jgi:hypothetical protein